MYRQTHISNGSGRALKRSQLEALKSLSTLLVLEVKSLEREESALEKDIKDEKPICLRAELRRFESNMIRCALIRSMGNQTKAAGFLGLKTTTLNSKVKRYKIDLTDTENAP